MTDLFASGYLRAADTVRSATILYCGVPISAMTREELEAYAVMLTTKWLGGSYPPPMVDAERLSWSKAANPPPPERP